MRLCTPRPRYLTLATTRLHLLGLLGRAPPAGTVGFVVTTTADAAQRGALDVVAATPMTDTSELTTVHLPDHPATTAVTVHRLADGQTATVERTVTDGCGDRSTFVGGGPGAF
jgi:hypothetical protein